MKKYYLALLLVLGSWASSHAQLGQAIKYQKEGEYEKAIEAIEKMVAKDRKKHISGSFPDTDFALTLEAAHGIYFANGIYEKALSFSQEAASLWKRKSETHPVYFKNLFRVSFACARMGRHAEVEKTLDKQKNPSYFLEGGKEVVTFSSIANVYQEANLLEKAEQSYLKGLQMYRSGFDGRRYKNLLIAGLTNLSDLNSYAGYVMTLNEMATFYESTTMMGKAEPVYDQLVSLAAQKLGIDHLDYQAALANKARYYRMMGRFAEAERLFLDCIAWAEKNKKKKKPIYPITLLNLGVLYNERPNYDYDKAESYLKKSIEALESDKSAVEIEKNDSKNYDYSSHYINLGGLYLNWGDFSKAEQFVLKGLRLLENRYRKSQAVFNAGHKFYDSWVILGTIYQAKKQYEIAEQYLLKAHATQRNDDLNNTRATYALCQLYVRLGKYAEAEKYFVTATQNTAKFIGTNFPFLSEKEKSDFLQRANTVLEAFNSFVVNRHAANPGITDVLYDNHLVTKAALANSLAKVRDAINAEGNTALKDKFNQWKELKTYLLTIYRLTDEEKRKRAINEKELELKANQLEKELSQQSASFARQLGRESPSWNEIKQKLKPGEAAIEIIRFRKLRTTFLFSDSVCYAALIIKPGISNPIFVLLQNGDLTEDDIWSEYNAYTQKDKEPVSDNKIFDRLWKPINAHLTGIQKVYVSPDGIYHKVNLSTLKNPAKNNFLLEEINIQLVGTTKDLIVRPTKNKPIATTVLLGFPDYEKAAPELVDTNVFQVNYLPIDTDSIKRSLKLMEGGKIRRLPATKAEVESITKLLSKGGIKTKTYINQNATETVLKKLARPSILHIASHGFFLLGADKTDKRTIGLESRKVEEDPMLKSGLLLAGAQKTLLNQTDYTQNDDGILTAYEAMNLDLTNSELVVLSACETGLGEIKNGEGVYGLQRAFHLAGARSILMSLWKVDDTATQLLFISFYENWMRLKDKGAAQNKLRANSKYAHPYYWGAFVLVGE